MRNHDSLSGDLPGIARGGYVVFPFRYIRDNIRIRNYRNFLFYLASRIRNVKQSPSNAFTIVLRGSYSNEAKWIAFELRQMSKKDMFLSFNLSFLH
jgi:hypothetical protein